MTQSRPDLARHVVTVAIAIAITVLLLLPGAEDELPDWYQHADKVYHVILFAALALPTALGAPRNHRWLLPMGLALGVALEFIQPAVGRTFSLADMVANAVGLTLGSALGLTLRRCKDSANPR